MRISVNGAGLWFDVDGPELVPDGAGMRERPTVVLVHGGPASYVHSYFKPQFGRLSDVAQVVYLDLRDHGRSTRQDPALWTFEQAADDIRGFCDALGIVRPFVLGHSAGGMVAMLYGERHPGHAGGLVLESTMARLDLDRLAEGFRRVAGGEIAELARREFGGVDVTDEEWDRIFAAFGPHRPSREALARRIGNPDLGRRSMDLMRALDLAPSLTRVTARTLVCVGELDPVTPVAASREIVDALPPGVGRLAVLEGAGHFPWLDVPDRYWRLLTEFIES